MVDLDYKDTVQVVKTHITTDGYGTEIIEEIADVEALFISNTGWQHGSFQTDVTSDAEVYLNPENDFIVANAYRLEGMYVVSNRFGDSEPLAWYKITQVIIGEDKLLGNEIDNVNCQLKKTSEVPGVS